MTTNDLKALPALTLDGLLSILQTTDRENREAENDGRPAPHSIEWDNLPTFGGAEPHDTTATWSWDERRLLVGRSADDLEIVDRVG